STQLAERAVKKIDAQLEKLVGKGKMKADERSSIVAHIHPNEGYAAFAECDKAANPNAILASNTSSISITLLGAQTKRPEKVIGMHFMNPVPVMKLVEVVRGLATSEETYHAVVDLGQRFGKTLV